MNAETTPPNEYVAPALAPAPFLGKGGAGRPYLLLPRPPAGIDARTAAQVASHAGAYSQSTKAGTHRMCALIAAACTTKPLVSVPSKLIMEDHVHVLGFFVVPQPPSGAL